MPEECADHDYCRSDDPPPPSTTLKSCVKTRWNSKYTMLDSVLKNIEVVNSLLDAHKNSDLKLGYTDRYLMSHLVKFRLPFKESTTELEGNFSLKLNSDIFNTSYLIL